MIQFSLHTNLTIHVLPKITNGHMTLLVLTIYRF